MEGESGKLFLSKRALMKAMLGFLPIAILSGAISTALARRAGRSYPPFMRTASFKHLTRGGKRPLDPGGVLLDLCPRVGLTDTDA